MAAISLVSISTSPIVYAGPTMTTTVDKVRVRPFLAYVKLANCPKYSQIALDTEYDLAMFTVALTAAASGQTVNVEFVDPLGCQAESKFVYFEVDF